MARMWIISPRIEIWPECIDLLDRATHGRCPRAAQAPPLRLESFLT